MKKVVYTQFGNESVLELRDFPIPEIKESELRIRVRSASINPLDWKIYNGEMKLMSGSKFPKSVGIDFSGIVDQAGAAVTNYKAGDEVIGMAEIFKGGALAEYLVVNEKSIFPKPAGLSFEQAAALPVTGLSALQILGDLAGVKKGQKVLINGASGGIGIFAIQIAKKWGATVTAVTGAKGTAIAKSLGADSVLDYRVQNVLSLPGQFDTVIDLSGKLPFKSARKLMKPKATYVNTLPAPLSIIGSALRNLFSGQKYKILILKPTQEGYSKITALAKDGLDILIEKTYPLESVQQAYKEAAAGQVIGKSIINIPL